MKLDLLDVDQFVRANKLKAITSPVLMSPPGQPTPDGLLSVDIFGLPGSRKRMSTFAYVNLNTELFSPVAFKALIRKHRLLPKIVSGDVYARLDDDGNIVEDDEGETGITWLIKNYNKIRYERTESQRRDVELDLVLNSPRETVVIDKFPIIPAGLRDFNEQASTQGQKASVHQATEMYVQVVKLSNLMERFGDSPDSGVLSRLKLQRSLLEIYQYFVEVLAKKTGFIKANVLKKGVDYGASSVIVPMPMNADHPDQQKIKFGEIGVPINQLVAMFKPFFARDLSEFLSDEIRNIRQVESELNIEYELSDTAEGLVRDSDHINGLIRRFIDSPENRFDPVYPEQTSKKKIPFKIRINEKWEDLTLMDIFYILAVDIVETHLVMFKRYPIENHQSVAMARAAVLTTRRTREVTLRNRVYPFFPSYKDFPDPTEQLINATMINTSYCPAMKADFDGDTVFLIGLYSKEANQEAERLRVSKGSMLSLKGASSRELGGEGLAALYVMTRDNLKKDTE